MSEDTFESLFTIGVQTQTGIDNLNALDLALQKLDKKILESLDIVRQFNNAVGQMGAVSFQGSQGPVVPAYVPGVQSGMTPAGTIHSVSSKGFASPTQALAEVAAMRGAFDDIVRLTELELSKIPIAVRAKMQMSEARFRELKEKVVTRSIIPEMVMEINAWLNRIDTEGVTAKVLTMIQEIQAAMSRLGYQQIGIMPVSMEQDPGKWARDIVSQVPLISDWKIIDATYENLIAREKLGGAMGRALSPPANQIFYDPYVWEGPPPIGRSTEDIRDTVAHEIGHAVHYSVAPAIYKAMYDLADKIAFAPTGIPLSDPNTGPIDYPFSRVGVFTESARIGDILNSEFGRNLFWRDEIMAEATATALGREPVYPKSLPPEMQQKWAGVPGSMFEKFDPESWGQLKQLMAQQLQRDIADVIADSFGTLGGADISGTLREQLAGWAAQAQALTPMAPTPMLEAPTIEGEYKLLEGVGAQASAELGTIPAAAAEVVNEVIGQFEKLKDELVGHSLFPDLIQEINALLNTIDTEGVTAKVLTMIQEIQAAMAQLGYQQIGIMPVSMKQDPGKWARDIISQIPQIADYKVYAGWKRGGWVRKALEDYGATGLAYSHPKRILYDPYAGAEENLYDVLAHEIGHTVWQQTPVDIKGEMFALAQQVRSASTGLKLYDSEMGYPIGDTIADLVAAHGYGRGAASPKEIIAEAGALQLGQGLGYPMFLGRDQWGESFTPYEHYAPEFFGPLQELMAQQIQRSIVDVLRESLGSMPSSILSQQLSDWAIMSKQMVVTIPPDIGTFPPDIGTFEQMWPTAAAPTPLLEPPTIEGEYRLLEGTGAAAAAELQQIPAAAATVTGEVKAQFEKLSMELVGASIIPDMVMQINAWLARIAFPPNVTAELEAIRAAAQAGVPVSAAEQVVSPTLGDVTSRAPLLTEYWSGGELQKSVLQITEMFEVVDDITGQTGLTTKDTAISFNALGREIASASTATTVFADGTVRVKREVDEAGKSVSLLANRFFRHLTWILQGIVLWQGINAIQNLGRSYITTFSDMEQAAARTAFVIDSSMEQVRQAQLRAAGQVTPYGIQPTEAAGAQLMAARFGVQDADFMRQSAELAMVAQMDMAAATENLISIERTWGMELEETGHVLNVLATMYRMTPRDMQELLNVMREGPSLAAQFGQSFEENMMMIGRALTYVPSQTPAGMFSLLQRTINRIFTGETPEVLARRYGIGVISPETLAPRPGLEVMDEIAAKYRELRTEQEKTALAALIAGTRQGQAWADAKVLLDNWTNIGMRDAKVAITEWGNLSTNVAETVNNQVRSMKAEWGLLIQEIGDATGAANLYRDAVVGTREAISLGRRRAALPEQAVTAGIGLGDLIDIYERQMGTAFEPQPWWQQMFSIMPDAGQFTEAFLDWADEFLASLTASTTRGMRGGRGYATAAREAGYGTFGEFREERGAGLDIFSQRARQAAEELQRFQEDTSDASDRLSVWAAMLAAGWAPGAGVVDLSEYSASQINTAIAQSRADTERMIAAYRAFLERQGLGEVAIAEALKNFTDKLEMQVQFFRLPGGEIQLAEGRDLLFYLSQIEENTRPLEGIWNVPEGMRVWVPIESTFYGEWRKRQEEAAGEGEIMLDASMFEAATDRFGASVDAFNSHWTEVIRDLYPSREEGGTLWDERMDQYLAMTHFLLTGGWDPEQPWMGYSGAAERLGLSVDMFGLHVDRFGGYATGRQRAEAARSRSTWLADGDVQIPTPLDVNVNPSAISTGVQTGTVASGMPMAVNSMSTNIRALQVIGGTQLLYLMTIARNTAVPPVVNVTIPPSGGGSSGGGGGGPRPPAQMMSVLTREWLLSNGVFEVP